MTRHLCAARAYLDVATRGVHGIYSGASGTED